MKKLANIIILAAGYGIRFWPLSDKNLFRFLGEEVLKKQIKKFLPYAKRLFVVSNSDNFVEVKKIANSVADKNIMIVIQKGRGQAAGLLSTKKLIKGEALVLNNVDLFDEKQILPALIRTKEKYQLILTARKIKNYFPGGYLKFAKNKLAAVVEKPKPEEIPSQFYKMVVDYYADFPRFLAILEKITTDGDDVYEKGINKYLAGSEEKKVTFLEYKDYWYSLKYPWHVLDFAKHYLSLLKKSHFGKNVFVDKTAKIFGNVYLDDGVKIYEYAKVVGPCYIGKNSIIGNYSLVRESMIGDNCLIGGYSEVTRSYLGDKVYLHRNYLGDSVVENNVLFGAGAVCANFRFDEKEIHLTVSGAKVNSRRKKLGAIIGSNVKIGVNASLMPGVRIGSGSIIMPNSLIKRDYPL